MRESAIFQTKPLVPAKAALSRPRIAEKQLSKDYVNIARTSFYARHIKSGIMVLGGNSPERLMGLARESWKIESMHRFLDVSFL